MRSCNFKFKCLISTFVCHLNVLLRERKCSPLAIDYERWLINLKWGPASLGTGTFFSSLTRSHVMEDRRERLNSLQPIDLFTDTAAILNLVDLRSIMGCPGGTRWDIYARFSGKKRTSMYISRQKGDHYYIQTRHNDLFSHYNLFLGNLKKNRPEKRA